MPEEELHKLEVTPDKLRAYISYHRPKNGKRTVPSAAEIAQILHDAGIVFGVRQDDIDSFLRNFTYGRWVLVAEGEPAVDGTSEQIEHCFRTDTHVEYDQEEVRIDLRKVRRLNEVQPGEELSIKHPRTDPKPGMNIFGEPIPAKEGKLVSFKVGKGAELAEDGSRVIATRAGHATLVDGRITVLDTLVFDGDVDFSVGDIDFVGNLEVRGSVQAGFTLRTKGNMTIGGSVESATVDCGGTLRIGGFVFGHDKGRVTCRGDAYIKGISRAQVDVGGDLTVTAYIMNSHVAAGGRVIMKGDKSAIVGGTVRAFASIQAMHVGNRIATPTTLVVGYDPVRDVQLAKMKEEWVQIEARLKQTEALLARLSDPAVAEQLTPLQRNQVPKLQRQLELEKPRYEKIKREYEELKASSEVFPKPEIVVAGIIYPGVSISLRGSQLRISDALKEAKYYLTADGEVAFVGEEAPEKELWREEPKASEPE